MKKDKDLDELFRSKLLNFEQEPPAYLLENVLSGVAGKRRNRKIVFWKLTGVAAALLLAFIAGWQINIRNGQEISQAVRISKQIAPEVSPEKHSGFSAGQTIKEKPQLAVVNSDSRIKTHVSKPINENLNSKNSAATIEPTLIAENNERMLLKPLQSIYRTIRKDNKPANSLQKIKAKSETTDWAEKTIDQQIIEQNRQTILAQNSENRKGRWLVGAQVSPEYSVSRSSHTQVYASNMLNSSSSNPVDLGGGVTVQYKAGKRWSVQSGIYYSGMGQNSGNTSATTGKEYALASSDRGAAYFNTNVSIDPNSNKMSMNSTAGVIEFKGIPSGIVLRTNIENKNLASNAAVVSDARFIQNFEYIEIPLYLRYTLIDSRFDVEMLGGFSSNVLVGNQTYMESNNNKSLVGKTKDMETLNYSGTLGIGLKYGISKRIFLNVEPRIKYYLNSLNSNSAVNYKPYSIGVYSGLSYEF